MPLRRSPGAALRALDALTVGELLRLGGVLSSPSTYGNMSCAELGNEMTKARDAIAQAEGILTTVGTTPAQRSDAQAQLEEASKNLNDILKAACAKGCSFTSRTACQQQGYPYGG